MNIRLRMGSVCFAFFGVVLGFLGTAHGAERLLLKPVSLSQFTITEGEVSELDNGHLLIDPNSPKVRGVVNGETAQVAQIRFTYKGQTAVVEPLESGEIREQIGVKLRAQDACNVVYAMWRIAPESEFVVSVKSNPGQSESVECGNNGYTTISPQYVQAPPTLEVGSSHMLDVRLVGEALRVSIDKVLIWEGRIGQVSFTGPVGFRTDNAQMEFEFLGVVKTNSGFGARQ